MSQSGNRAGWPLEHRRHGVAKHYREGDRQRWEDLHGGKRGSKSVEEERDESFIEKDSIPKQRSDDRIREEIRHQLNEDHLLDATHVEVAVDSGEVTLSGSVPSRVMKRRVEEIAEGTEGVLEVRNELRVKRQPHDA